MRAEQDEGIRAMRGTFGGILLGLLIWGVVLFAVWEIKAHATTAHASRVASPRHLSALCNHGARHWTPREVRCAIRLGFAGDAAAARALRVAECETGGTLDTHLRNPSSGASGIFQIIRRWHPDAPNRFSPAKIIPWVYRITHNAADWRDWVCQP